LITVSMLLGTNAFLTAPATAESTTAVVSGGSLGLSSAPAVGDFVLVRLDGSARQTHAALDDFSVVDARGTGAGWTVSVQATQFREWDGTFYAADGKTLPKGSL